MLSGMAMVRCDVCNIEVNTFEQLTYHERGKQHLRKLQQRQLQEVFMEKAGSSISTSSPSTASPSFWCHLCNISCQSQANLEVHKAGASHQALLRQPPPMPPAPAVPLSVHCDVCDVDCNTYDQLAKHQQGAKHLKKLNQSRPAARSTTSAVSASAAPEVVNGVVQYRCTTCSIFCNTPEQLAIHESGDKHLKKMRTSAPEQRTFNPAVGAPVRSSYMCMKCNESFHTVEQQRSHRCGPVPPPRRLQAPPESLFDANVAAGLVVMSGRSGDVQCRVCNSLCNTKEAMEAHLSGARHQKNMKKLPPEMVTPAVRNVCQLTGSFQKLQIVEDTGPVEHSDGLVECKVCRLKMNANNAPSHFAGKQHRQKMVKALKAPEHPVPRPAISRRPCRQLEASRWTKTPPRKYQVELFQKALAEDCVVFLPTGTGKTLVSAMVLACMLDANPNYQAVFLVEKTLLVLQQADYLREELQTPVRRFDWENKTECLRRPLIASVCGDLADIEENRCLWQQDILVTTVAFYLNLLETEALRWEDLCLVVFDEAHHCVKDHPFNRLLREYSLKRQQSLRPKILGLTASPAGRPTEDETHYMVRQLLENMGKIQIAAVEQHRTDLDSFSSSCEIRTCHDAADPTEEDLQRHLMSTAAEIFDKVLPAEYQKYTTGLRAELAGASTVWDQVSKLTERLVEYAKVSDRAGAELAGLCLQAFHELQAGGWDLANPQVTILQQKLKARPPHLQDLKTAKKLNAAADAAAVTYASGENISRVMSNLVQLVVTGLQRSPTLSAGKAVVLVLTSQRSIAHSVSDYLDTHIREQMEDVYVTSIVGHGSTSGQKMMKQLGERSQLTKGMSVGQQQKLLKKIQDLHYKVIVATSVAEEGVDLPSCGLVILLAPPSTMTALVQMRGRARLRESQFIVLMREPQQEQKLQALILRETNMKRAVERVLAEQQTARW